MPDAPQKNDHHYRIRLDVPQIKADADREEKNRRNNETPSETLEQCAIAVGANHSRQMMAERAEGRDENVNLLCAPACLRDCEQWNDQERRPDIKNQVAPTI